MSVSDSSPASQSLAELLKRLGRGPIHRGWGAIAAFSRDRVNRMLKQQFTAAFTAARFIPPYSDALDASSASGEMALSSIVFGAPVLSFETASLEGAHATLTVPLISGSYTQVQRAAGRSPRHIACQALSDETDVVLKMDIDLVEVTSDSDHTGRIALDLGMASNPICTISADPGEQRRVGERLLAHLQAQPAYKTTYVLGLLDAGNYAPLSPVKCVIRTQPAPGAERAGAANAGDGAVLIFMKVKGWDNDGVELPGPDFPYLIPDDVANGEPLYSATVIIAHWLEHFVTDAQVAVLSNSMLPPGYAFSPVANGRYKPHDIAIFGNLVETRANVTIEPQLAYLDEDDSLQFAARRGDGSAVTGVSWSSACLNSPRLVGKMSAAGMFSAVDYPFAGPPTLMTTVTARYTENGQPAESSAFVLVKYQYLAIDPMVSSASPGDSALELQVRGMRADVPPSWSLLAPALGKLQPTQGPERMQYVPPAAGGVPFVAQRLEARDAVAGYSAQAVVMLMTASQTLPVEPPFVGAVFGQAEITFEVPAQHVREVLAAAGVHEEDADFVFWRWSVVGDGTVVGEGRTARFIPSATRSQSMLTVVVCEVIGPGIEHLCGYSVVELTRASVRDYPRWKELTSFDILTPDGVQVYANGMQQIRLQIRIETKDVDVDGFPQNIPISDVELASLKLIRRGTGAEVPFVDPNQEGIEHDDGTPWAVSERRNRFRLHTNQVVGDRQEPLSSADGDMFRERTLYLHLKTDESAEIYAQFQAEDGRIMTSLESGSDQHEAVVVKGTLPPGVVRDDYRFERERVWTGEGQPVGDDDFSYVLQSTDFWSLDYIRGGFDPIGFSTLRIEGNTSTIQWESELLDETFFSCTGYAFSPKHRLQPVAPAQLEFDPYLGAMMNEVTHALPNDSFHSHPPSPGQLIVSLHRDWDVTYWYDGMAVTHPAKRFRKSLDGPVLYTLRDEDGTRHQLQIGFPDRSLTDSRNRLNLIIQ